MTRENKLALVVGFGLILFVGILVSDHFAPEPRRGNADLHDPLLAAGPERPRGVIDLEAARPPVAHAPGSGDPIRPLGPDVRPPAPRPEERPQIVLGPEIPPALPPQDPLVQPAQRDYVVQRGDTLYRIASSQLGDGSRWRELGAFNGIRDANAIQPGMRIRLPGEASGQVTRVALDDSARGASTREYTVREGDTLSSIAERLLGRRSRWQEIFDLNRERLKDPNRVAPGTRIVVPVSEDSTRRASSARA